MVEYNPTCISLFAGCGGSSWGYHLAGYKELLAIDFDDNAVDTFKLNFKDVPIWKADISQLSGTKIMNFCGLQVGELDLLDGSPPCQGFSTAGKRQVCDIRNDLVNHYIRLVKAIQPKVFVMENVSGMVKGKMKGLFIEYVSVMKDAGYQVSCRLLNAKWFSVPQSRQRMICIGVRNDLKMQPVFPKAHERIITVKEAIGDLRGNTPQDRMIPQILKTVAKYQPRTWSTDIKIYKRYKGNLASSFSLKWMDWNRICGTLAKSEISLTGIIHPDRERYISLSEAKRIGSFPDDFKFVDRETGIMRIGNSVPPLLTKAIAETIRDEIFGKL